MDAEVHRWFQAECYDCGWIGDVFMDKPSAERDSVKHDCADNQRAWSIHRNQNGDPHKRHEFVAVLSTGIGEDRHFVLSEVDLAFEV